MTGLYGVIVFFVAVFLYYGVVTYSRVIVSKELIDKAEVYEHIGDATVPTLLVLGDSTGVGVGADSPEDTVSARLARDINSQYVENYAVSGARVRDLNSQRARARLEKYTYILIEIGGNDIIRFHNAESEAQRLEVFLKTLPMTEHLIVHSSGNVGSATFFPWFIRPLHTKLNLAYHEAFERVVTKAGGTYVNLFADPVHDLFYLHPEIYLATDGLHPSSAGYGLWFEEIRKKLQND